MCQLSSRRREMERPNELRECRVMQEICVEGKEKRMEI
jgi:hypothetical protein